MSAGTELYRVSEDFASLLRLRDIMISEGEDVGPLEQTIAEYFSGDLTRERIDVVIGALRYAETMEAAAKAEAERCAKMARSWQTQREWLKVTVQRVMEMAGKKRLEGSASGYLLLKGNGGKPAVEITEVSLIPPELLTVTMTMQADAYDRLWPFMAQVNAVPATKTVEPHRGRITAALERHCEFCQGEKSVDINCSEPCPICSGSGKNIVPGARLAERGQHVEMK